MGTEWIIKVVKRLRASYDAGITKSYEWRMEQLTQLKKMLAENRNEIIKAGKSPSLELH
jgi:hypothetical protein